jgi:cell wall-associated NlpC family hydrolase
MLAILATIVPRPASASPLDDKKAEAARLQAQIETLGNRESALAERYNGALLDAQTAARKQATAQAQLAVTTQHAGAVRRQVRDAAVHAYVQGPTEGAPVGSGVRQTDPVRAQYYSASLSRTRADALDALRAATLQLNEQKAQVDAAKRRADAGLQQVDASRRQVLQAQAALNATLAKVKGDLAALVAQAEAARRADEAARARARLASASRNGNGNGSGLRPGPATRQSAGVAVAEALRQVGKPYQWGAAGPDSFDCSGLTMWAWRAAGVTLSHYTGAQYSETTHIPLSDLQSGDLVYSGDMGHMAMYIGNGNMVEAPHTGANVRVVPLRSDMTLASRP